MLSWIRKDDGTFRKIEKSGDKKFQGLGENPEGTLGAGDLKSSVKLPQNENINDWLAMNVVEFYNSIGCLYNPIMDSCTKATCSEMNAGPNFKYAWQDNDKFKKPTMLSAPEYITNLMGWIEALIDNSHVFPSDPNVPFPKDFRAQVSKIFTRLFRVYAHIYYNHLQDVKRVGAEAHLNTSFRHFILFAKEFDLIPEDQQTPLKDIIQKMIN